MDFYNLETTLMTLRNHCNHLTLIHISHLHVLITHQPMIIYMGDGDKKRLFFTTSYLPAVKHVLSTENIYESQSCYQMEKYSTTINDTVT